MTSFLAVLSSCLSESVGRVAGKEDESAEARNRKLDQLPQFRYDTLR